MSSCKLLFQWDNNRIGGVMVSILTSSAIDRGLEPRSGQTKDHNIGNCCLSAKYAVLRRKSKDWLAPNQNNVSEWSDLSTRGLLFQWASTMEIQPKLGWSRTLKINLFPPWHSWKIAELALNNNQWTNTMQNLTQRVGLVHDIPVANLALTTITHSLT